MTQEQLLRHPEEKWCCAEILEHLLLTYTGTIKAMELCLQSGKPVARVPTFKERIGIFVVTGLGYMPEGRTAPERARPRGMDAAQVAAEIGPKVIAMDEIIGECEVRFGRRAHVREHPILGPLTCEQWRKFHVVHGEHHLKQIERLKGS
jgi:hypothetical protein